jgi:hypothetical protein
VSPAVIWRTYAHLASVNESPRDYWKRCNIFCFLKRVESISGRMVSTGRDGIELLYCFTSEVVKLMRF